MAVEELALELPAEVIAKLQQNGLIKNGVMEAFNRGKHNRYKTFFKLVVNTAKKPEAQTQAAEVVALLKQNTQIGTQSIEMLGNITKLSQFTLVLSGLNLFATTAGFIVMNEKLKKISGKIDEVIRIYKEAEDIHTTFEMNKVLSAHSDMLDHRKTQNYYSEEQMRKLVAEEYNMLDMLINIFTKDMSNDKETIVLSLLSLASMLSASLKYFDEIYYFKNKDSITYGDFWHLDHDNWTSSFDKMLSKELVEKIQDYGLFDLGLNTEENDCFYKNYRYQVKSLKQDVKDNQLIITSLDDRELFNSYTAKSSESFKNEIESALKEVGADKKYYEKAILAAAA